MAQSKSLSVENGKLKLTFSLKTAALDVIQKKSGTVWKMDTSDREDITLTYKGQQMAIALSDATDISAKKNMDGSIRIVYRDFKAMESSLWVAIVVELDNEDINVVVDLNDADPDIEFDSIYYPRSFLLPNDSNSYWICPFGSAGKLVPGSHRKSIDARLGWKPRLKCHGAVQKSSGFLCVWDSIFDTYLAEMNSPRTGPRFFTRSLESLGRFRYKRGFRFCFREKTDYTKLIRGIYRPVAERRGYLVPLLERAKDKPSIKDLPGTMIYHQLIAYVNRRTLEYKYVTFDFAQKVFKKMVKTTGIKKGLYHLDGWCRQGYDALHPDVFPPLGDAGGEAGMARLSKTVNAADFHFGLHDNYLLYFPDAEQFDEEDCVWDRRLKPYRDQFRAGGINFVQSPAAAKRFLEKNYITGQKMYRRRWRPVTDYCNLGFCYLDQFLHSGGAHEQDFNPKHPLTREEFVEGMLEMIDVMGEKLGVITSSEHMYEFGMPHYDVNGNSTGVGLKSPSEGIIPVPLWELAFHEVMVPTDEPRRPQNFVSCALIGGVMHHRPGYNDNDRINATVFEGIRRAEPLRKLHQEICFREMTGHKLLSSDGNRQVSEFDGITVTGDFKAATVQIKGSKKADGTYDFSDLGGYDQNESYNVKLRKAKKK